MSRGFVVAVAVSVTRKVALLRAGETLPARVRLPSLPRAQRLSLAGFGLAAVTSAALLLWAGQDYFFFSDELTWFAEAPPDYDPGVLLRPSNTHLIAVPRIVHATLLHAFGPDYLPWRVTGVIGVVACAGLFFLLARRRIGELALLPTIVLLFLGSSWDTVVSPVGLPFLLATGAGLGSLLALERSDRRGDVAACVLATVAVASHSFGLIFLVGVAVSILVGRDRVRRAWVFATPLALYVLWWSLAARPPGAGGSLAQASNLLLLPPYAVVALGAAVAAVTGLNELDFATVAGFNRLPERSWILTPPLGLAAGVLVLLRLRRGNLRPAMWAFLATLVAFLVSIGVSVGPGRPPTAARYLFPGAVIVLLVAAEAARGVRSSRRVVGVLVAVTAFSLAVNLFHLLEARTFLNAYAINAGPTLTMVELARAEVDSGFRPGRQARGASAGEVGVPAGAYLRGIANWGSVAPTLEEVRRRPRAVRDRADVVLARAKGLRLVPATSGRRRDRCTGGAGRPVRLDLRPGERTVLENLGGGSAIVALRRFGPSFAASVGGVAPGETALVGAEGDAAPEPWEIRVSGAAVRACRL